MKVPLRSTGAASRKDCAGLLAQRGHILPVFSLVVPCQPGASPVSVRRGTFITASQGLGEFLSEVLNRPGQSFVELDARRPVKAGTRQGDVGLANLGVIDRQ